MRTTLKPNAPTRPHSAAPSLDGQISLGQIDLLGPTGAVARNWQITRSKCVVGSSANCFIQINEPGINDQHLSLVFGKRHTLLRAIGPTKIQDRNVREWLIDVPTEVSLGSLRIVIHPFKPVSETVVQVERLIDQAARLCKDPFFVSSNDALEPSASDLSSESQNSPADTTPVSPIDTENQASKDENLTRLENIETLLSTLQSSLERFRESVTLESKQTTEAVAQSLTSEFETFGQSLFSSLSQQMTQQTETHQTFVSNLSERVVDRLDEMDQQLVSVKEASLKSSEELLQRASAYQEWIEIRLNEVVAQRTELIEAIQSLRNEIQLGSYPAQNYSESSDSNTVHFENSLDRIDRQSESSITDQRIAESLERAQLQLRSYNQEIQQLASERQATEQQLAYLAQDRQAVEAIDPTILHDSQQPETSQAFDETYDQGDNTQEYVTHAVEGGYEGYSNEHALDQHGPQEQGLYQDQYADTESQQDQFAQDDERTSLSEYPGEPYYNDQHVENQQDEAQYEENRFEAIQYEDPNPIQDEAEAYSSSQEVYYPEVADQESPFTHSDSQQAWDGDSYGDSESFEAIAPDEPTLQPETPPKLPAWFTDSEPSSGDVNVDPPSDHDLDESRSQRLQEMLRQVSNNFREPNYELDRRELESDGSQDSASNPSESHADDFQPAADSYTVDRSEVASLSYEEAESTSQEEPINGLASGNYFSGFLSEESTVDQPGSVNQSFGPVAHVNRMQADPPIASASRESEEGNASNNAGEDEESIEQYMQRLLNRVRTGSDSEPAPSTPSNRSSGGRQESVVLQQHDSSQEALPEQTASVKQEPLTQASFVPRMQAPELRDDLNMLRELANTNARRAINRSDIRRINSTFYFKLGVTGVAAASAVCLLMLNGLRINMPFAGMISAIIVAFLWGYDSIRHFKKSKAQTREPVEVNQQTSLAVEPVNPPQNQENRWRPTPV